MRIGLAEGSRWDPRSRRSTESDPKRPSRDVPLPFRTMLDAPELATALQSIGEYIRFRSSLPARSAGGSHPCDCCCSRIRI